MSLSNHDHLRRSVVAACLIAAVAAMAGASEVTAVWERVYRQAVSDEQRYTVMLKIMELKDKDFAPLISESLDKLYVKKIETANSYETRNRVALAKLLIQELGNLRSMDDVPLVLNIYRDAKDPFLKAEAAVALGKMRAAEALEQLARDLADLNLKPDSANPRPREILAYGLVQALELMHAPAGFEPVFFASLGWYSGISQVKETARAALKNMIDDPTPQLMEIIRKDTDFVHKLRALEAADASQATASAKCEVARLALYQGLNAHENDPALRNRLIDLRMKSLKMLGAYQDKSEASVELYRTILANRESGLDELLVTYVVLGLNGTKPAIDTLIARMADYNARQTAGKNTPDDRKIILQIIQSMKDAKNPAVKPVLVEAQFINHDAYVIRMARDAADSLK